MMELTPVDSSKKRNVPYISELTKLLYVNFDDIETEDNAHYMVRSHFVQEYPSLDKLKISRLESHYLSDFLDNRQRLKDLWVRAEREIFVGIASDKGVAFDDILQENGSLEDVSLAEEIMLYVSDRGILGVPGYELKDTFSNSRGNCSLELILNILIKHNVIFRTGVTTNTFVHVKFRDPWLTGTFQLNSEKDDSNNESTDANKWYQIKSLPWFTLDGKLNRNVFKMWLTHAFSYCIDNPQSRLWSVCDKFCYLKPVDVFYLLEVLEEIGALELRRFPLVEEVDLFSKFDVDILQDCKATMLDRFEEIYVQTHNLSFTALGAFFHSLSV